MNRWIDVYKIFDTKKILRTTGEIFNFKSKDSSFHQCVMSDSLFVHVDIDAVFRNLISVKNPWLNCYGKSFTSVQQRFRIKLKSSFQNLKLKKKMNNTQEITTCYRKITAKNIKQIEYRSKLVF